MLKTERAEKMNRQFAETLKKLRTSKGLSQRELAERMFVNRSTVARWESGSRLPDAVMISRLSQCLSTDVNILLSAAAESDDAPNVIMVDDRKLFLSGALPILEEAMPDAIITGFNRLYGDGTFPVHGYSCSSLIDRSAGTTKRHFANCTDNGICNTAG